MDGYWCAIRAYFATRRMGLANSRGESTGAIFGLSKTLLRLREHVPSGEHTTHLAVMLDPGLHGSWRRAIHPDYKTDRVVKFRMALGETEGGSSDIVAGPPSRSAEVRQQLDLLPAVCEAFGVQFCRAPGYEADDLIHTYAAEARTDSDVWVFTGDKDLVQVVDDNVRLFSVASLGARRAEAGARSRSSSHRPDVVDLAQARRHWNVEPHQMADLLALAGDPVDCVPGIPGIGPVRAAALLKDYGNLDGVLTAASSGKMRTRGIGAKLTRAIAQHADQARTMRKVVGLCEVPGHNGADYRTKFRLKELNKERAIEFCTRHDFHSLIGRIEKDSGDAPASAA